jgi:uncharacterized membrane protein YfhO
VKDQKEALEFIKNSGSLTPAVALLENSQRRSFEGCLNKMHLSSQPFFDRSGSVKKIDIEKKVNYFAAASGLGLEADIKNPSLLVISDLYYPGWKAFLDGQDWPVFRCDCLFRAVLVPAGKHQLLFEYRPLSFTFGIILFIITTTILLGSAWGHRRISKGSLQEQV